MSDNQLGLFFGEFIRNPLRTAAIAPSSASLAAQMVAPLRNADLVVELGPGTGAFTGAIQRRLNGRGKHLAIELNERLAETLSERYPGVEVVTADATQLPKILADRGLTTADVVVSGLPWAAYSGAEGAKLVDIVSERLKPTGAFTQFTYAWSRWAPPARRQLSQLRAAFGNVELSRTVWQNLPPATVYTASQPRRPAAI